MKTTISLPDDLVARARRRAAREERTLSDLIEEGLRRIVPERPKVAGARRRPRISDRHGRVRPGVDIVHTSALLDRLEEGEPSEKRR